jgi:CheY-like chemotaxis protein
MIVAIEPDRRRAAQLTGMARAHLGDELLVATSAAQAVDALNGRVPDVLLTAPLLPSQEETAIAEYLRQLGSAAAHVQTLTIPLLASSSAERDRPVLSAFRRGRAQHVEAEGCDPAVFAEQITEYLREARERKVVVPPPSPSPAVDVVESATEADSTEPDLASFAVEDAPPMFTGRSFKELLARLDVSEVDEPIVAAPVVDESSFGKDLPSANVMPMTVIAEPTIPSLVDEAAPVKTAVVVPDPPRPVTRGRKSQRREDWALFDPKQYGFPALIAKLDEIAARDSDA